MSKTRVLIVDDEPNLARLSGVILENSGLYEVMIVNQATRAIAAAIEFQPAVMLLDVDMPVKTGGDIAHEAAMDSRLQDIPVLFLTGLVSRQETGNKQLQIGGFRYLSKPVEPAVLLASVAALIEAKVAA
jgi:CheY-like chemotaxis protein